MATESGKIRALTTMEAGVAETKWIKHVRRNMVLQGVCVAICAVLEISYGGFLFIAGAVVLSLVLLSSWRDLNLIANDVAAGRAEEILGSVRQPERGFVEVFAAMFGAFVVLLVGLARIVKHGMITRRNRIRPASVGSPLILVRSHSTELIRLAPGMDPGVADGTLVKAVVLPESRVALRIGRASLGDS